MSVRVQITMRLDGKTAHIRSMQRDWDEAIAFASSTTRLYEDVDMVMMVRYPTNEVILEKGEDDGI